MSPGFSASDSASNWRESSEAAGDGSESWVPDTHMGDPDEFPAPRFSLVQPYPLQTLGEQTRVWEILLSLPFKQIFKENEDHIQMQNYTSKLILMPWLQILFLIPFVESKINTQGRMEMANLEQWLPQQVTHTWSPAAD